MKNIHWKTEQLSVFLLLLLSPFFVLAQVTAEFTANQTSGCSPLIVNFENLSTGSGLSYQWDLGNGNASVSENPAASYINPGTYNITLTITGTDGNDTQTKTGFITVFTPPTPNILPSQTIGCYPFTVNFSDLSVAGDSPIATWAWDFGDGSTSNNQNPEHTYTTPGVFDITLLLTDANGCASNLSFNDFIESNNNTPTAEFTANPLVSCLPPVDVAFANTSFGGTGNLTYNWNFGDGNSSIAAQPINTYLGADQYNISLTVTDELGCTDTQLQNNYVEIVDNVTVDFLATNTTICLGDFVSFIDISSPEPTSWQWNFGDGNTSTDSFVTHTYTSVGVYEVSLTATYSASCQDTETKTAYITVGQIPFVDFTADVISACQRPLDVNFTNNSIGTGTLSYNWSFGNGNTSLDENPQNTYLNDGTYTVSLTTTNNLGCSGTITRPNYINITETAADFLPDLFGFCQPLEVNFSDLSISGTTITDYQWNFGDGGTSIASNPTYIYADTGIFDVSLIITNDLGCTDTLTRTNYIFVYTPPVANFFDDDTVICMGEIDFTDLSLNATDWFWDFGDGNVSTDQHPTNLYQDTGFFNITLIALNNGCADTLEAENMLYVSPPAAGLTYSFDCQNPNTFTFNNQSEGYTSWSWLLPDSSTSMEDPLAITFPDTGMYIIRINTANDTSGCTNSATDTVYVTGLEAGFSAANTQNCGPLDVIFTDESTGAISWEWFFGTGAVSAQQEPAYTYSYIGTYSVTQVVTDINGCTDTVAEPDLVTVTGAVVNFGIDTTFGCDSLAVQFADLTQPPGTIANWLWDFGDGNTSTLQNPLYIYMNAGNFDVTLTTTDIGGCVNTTTQSGLVNYIPYPAPNFTVNNTVGCMGQPFTFTNISTGNAASYLWNFGDGATSTEANPEHSYNSQGIFSITLTAFNSNGCDSSFTEISLINVQHPDANFSATPTFAFCPPLLVSSTDMSSSDAVSWFWDFGNGSSSSLQNPAHIYTESGTFTVSLTVTNANGCTDTIYAPDLIELSGPSGNFTFLPDSVGCPPYEVIFTSNVTNVSTYIWDFGDGFLGSGAVIPHVYTGIGTYIPTLILEDDNGCTFTYQSEDTLSVQPLAVNAGASETICQNDSVQLSATGGDAFSWFPSTGLDDSSLASPQANPTVTTEYVVSVMLGLCQNTDTVTVFVNPGPQANFAVSEVCFGSSTQFTNLSVIAAPDSIIGWHWNLNQTLSNDTNPTILYAQAGTFPISLTIESSSGCSNTAVDSVTVNPTPVAAFSANDTCLFFPTFFADESTTDVGTITSWNWQLGNGATSLEQDFMLTYFEDSVYEVTLIVSATGGCTDTTTQEVTVFPLPVAQVFVDNVCLGEPVIFIDSSTVNSGSIISWNWVFGDGNSSTEQHPEHFYTDDLNYVYGLLAITNNGCQATASGAVTVYPLPTSNFEMTSSASCFSPVSVNIFNQSQGANQFAWNLDNGTTETTFNTTAIFDSVGQYNIQLTVVNTFGCMDSSTQLFEVFPTVVADFENTFPLGCEPWQVAFTNLSENGTEYNWNFSDGDGSSNIDPEHIFFDPGSYSVALITSGLGGCADTVVYTDLVTVWQNPTAVFEYTNIMAPIANGTVAFYNTSTPHVGSWWSFGNGSTSFSENATHRYEFYGNKIVTLAIVDSNGCADTLQRYIPVDFFGGLFVPNALIPTDDNVDVRVFLPKGTGLGKYRCIIFDKWGNRLWESNKLNNGSPAEGWDGTYKGKTVPQGAYVWKIDAVFANGELWDGMENTDGKFNETGSVTVIW